MSDEETVPALSILRQRAGEIPLALTVIESQYCEDGQMIVFSRGDGTEYPPEWETMTTRERLTWALSNARLVVVKNLEKFRASL